MATVRKDDDGTWSYTCPQPSGCGADGVSFSSAGWPSKGTAAARGAQHDAEHEGGPVMQSLDDFRNDQGVRV